MKEQSKEWQFAIGLFQVIVGVFCMAQYYFPGPEQGEWPWLVEWGRAFLSILFIVCGGYIIRRSLDR